MVWEEIIIFIAFAVYLVWGTRCLYKAIKGRNKGVKLIKSFFLSLVSFFLDGI